MEKRLFCFPVTAGQSLAEAGDYSLATYVRAISGRLKCLHHRQWRSNTLADNATAACASPVARMQTRGEERTGRIGFSPA
jgi:hypothetical protein